MNYLFPVIPNNLQLQILNQRQHFSVVLLWDVLPDMKECRVLDGMEAGADDYWECYNCTEPHIFLLTRK